MADFDGKTLAFRDDVEREAWGRVFASVPATISGLAAEIAADKCIIQMRIRQRSYSREIYNAGSNILRTCCAVCDRVLTKKIGDRDPAHAEGCPLGGGQ